MPVVAGGLIVGACEGAGDTNHRPPVASPSAPDKAPPLPSPVDDLWGGDGGAAPRSLILVIADGTGVGPYTRAFYDAQRDGQSFPFTRFTEVGLMITHPDDMSIVTDSAASATALATGVKVPNGYVGTDITGMPRENLFEIAQSFDLALGLVVTSTISHATPAAFVTHVPSRHDEAGIMAQLLAHDIDVVFGGGQALAAPHIERLIEAGTQVVFDLVTPIDPQRPVVGLLAPHALPSAAERDPSTADMAARALELLGARSSGFVLLVEESQLDWAAHDNDELALSAELASFGGLVDTLLDYQKAHPDTLLMVTSDHETGSVGAVDPGEGNGMVFGTSQHTANFVPIWAVGPGARLFGGLVDNARVGATLHALLRAGHEAGTTRSD